jgi:GR25 family glycosyltransferase involved in LPS biosynthesis
MFSLYQSNNSLIYCINLQHREDRKIHTYNEFKKIGISPNKVIYPPFVKDTRGGAFGCYDSHMKIWHNFFYKHPEYNYCLVFEDDFVAQPQAKELLEKAYQFIAKNSNQIDFLFLHNLCVPVQHPLNNNDFTNGYACLAHAYFIMRPYIQNLFNKNQNRLPAANGNHLDFLINWDKNNLLYTEKIFYTKQSCFTQLLDKSDNYFNKLDELFRQDINKRVQNSMDLCKFIKKRGLLNDNQIKKMSLYVNKLVIG